MRLEDLFPDGDYRHHLTLRRGHPREFFAPRDETGALRAERCRWLDAAPARHAVVTPEGEPLLREFSRLLVAWELAPSAALTVAELGRLLEPDVLLLSRDAAGLFRLRGGALCFPTGWALEEKNGQTLDAIHGVVPGLNAALGPSIHQVLGALKPGVALLRDNWGIAATPELNLHPARRLPSPEPPVDPTTLWLRVEHQALAALPETGGIVFGIRLSLHRLDTVLRGPAGAALRRSLATMSPEMASYKRLDKIIGHLVNVV